MTSVTAWADGTTGDSTWTLSGGTLTISPTNGVSGAMADYSSGEQPWIESSSSITSVVVSDGVTNIGDYAFYYCVHLTSVSIATSVTSIGESAFGNSSVKIKM